MLNQRYTFTKNERLCLKKQIDRLFSDGRWLRSNHLRFLYLEVGDDLPSHVQVMFTAPKKIHRTAVARNILKRRMRESYRLHKSLIYETLGTVNKKLIVAFVYNSDVIVDFKTINGEIQHLLAQLSSRLTNKISPS
jgi:ribonuclease P protein component